MKLKPLVLCCLLAVPALAQNTGGYDQFQTYAKRNNLDNCMKSMKRLQATIPSFSAADYCDCTSENYMISEEEYNNLVTTNELPDSFKDRSIAKVNECNQRFHLTTRN